MVQNNVPRGSQSSSAETETETETKVQSCVHKLQIIK